MQCGRYRALILALFATALSVPAWASPESEKLLDSGIAKLGSREYRNALADFNAATKADPNDYSAAFFQGVALNRLGQAPLALVVLQRAEKAGYQNRDLDFEFGWALMNTLQYKDAIARLERFEAANPGRGQTSEFLGRCYLRLGQLDKAEALFLEALKRDPRLKPSLELDLAFLAGARGNKEAVVSHLTTIVNDAPESGLGRALREQAGGGTTPPAQKPFNVTFSAATGYNDNVIGLGNTIPLPSDITHKGAAFIRGNLGLAYSRRIDNESDISVGYALLHDTYDGISIASLTDNFVYGDYRRKLSDRLSFALRLADEYTFLSGDKFRNQRAVRPALAYRFTQNTATEFSYTYSAATYFQTPLIPAFDRSGDADTFEVLHYWFSEGKPLASVGYSHVDNHADGSDFTFSADGLSARISHALGNKFVGEAGAAFTHSRYDNPNSLSGFARSDDIESFVAQVLRPINAQAQFFVRYSGIRNRSNIAFYTFNQNVESAGIEIKF